MLRWIFYLLIFGTVSSCTYSSTANHQSSDGTGGFTPKYARGYKVLRTEPSIQILLFNLESEGDTLAVIELEKPAERAACLSTTHLAMFNKIGHLNVVKAVGYANLVKNKNALDLIRNGEMINLSTGDDVDNELLIASSPDIFLVYPFGNAGYNKYEELGIKCIPISEYLEESPLGRAEWIRLVGTLLGCGQLADSVFNAIESNYITAETLLEGLSDNENKPVVFTGSREGDTWFSPPGNSAVGHLIEDAGGHYLFRDSINSGNILLPFEKLIVNAHQVDFWGSLVFSPGPYSLQKARAEDPRLQSIKAFQEGHIFYCNTSETDYFGDAMLEPDILLKDLIRIFHPNALPMHQPVYFEMAR